MTFSKQLKKSIQTPGINSIEDLQLYGLRKELKKGIKFRKQLQRMGINA